MLEPIERAVDLAEIELPEPAGRLSNFDLSSYPCMAPKERRPRRRI